MLKPQWRFNGTMQSLLQPYPKWEYHEFHNYTRISMPALAQLGEEGWELVSVHIGSSNYHTYYFKRRKIT